ncbi:MAG: MarR family transcriptional regulator [Bifidobacteriaceae bacterium]|nr:MarR family transcriptional regulator [Bifidobacteriaceae bacterium]
MWRIALADHGISIGAADSRHVMVSNSSGCEVMWLFESKRRVCPSQLRRPPESPALLIVPKATPALVSAAQELGWNVATDEGQFAVQIGKHRLSADPEPAEPPSRRPPGPQSWALFTLVRRLLADPGASQQQLAERAEISQPRASRLLAKLVDSGLVVHGRGWCQPSDWDQLADWWLREYPGPGGTVSYWTAVDSVTDQVRRAIRFLGAQGRRRLAVSGDVAADSLAPWRLPACGVVYCDRPADLTPEGFVSVASPQEATLAVHAPLDSGVWLGNPWEASGLPLADPLQIIRDTVSGPEPDRAEAAQHLRQALTTKHRKTWMSAADERPGP